MNVVSRGVRNAFRNYIRSFSIIVILGLAIGLALVMLIARQAVTNKISSVNSSIGNTISISPAGFSGFSSVNNTLTDAQLAKVTKLNHIASVTKTLDGRLSTIGAASSPFGDSSGSNANQQTSLSSPVQINSQRFIVGGGSSSGGFSLPSNFSPPIMITGTTDPTNLNGSAVSLSSGQQISGSANNNQALISSSMASKNSLRVGSTFTAYSSTLTVSGIFTASGNGLANEVIVSLPTEQTISSQGGDVTGATAYVDSLTNLTSATNEIKNSLGSAADITSSQQQAQDTVAPLNNIKTISLYSLVGALIAGVVIIFLIMVMIVRERRREIGVLKAIGASNVKVMWQFMSEAVTLTLCGAIIGIVIGVAAANPITHLLVNNSSSSGGGPGGITVSRRFGGGGFNSIAGGNGPVTLGPQSTRGAFRGVRNSFNNIEAVVGWSVVLDGIGAALIIALVGSSAASLLIARVRPADVMRAE